MGGFADWYRTYTPNGRRAAAEQREQEKFELEKKQAQRDEEWKVGRQKLIGEYTSEPIFTDDGEGNRTQIGTRPKPLDTASLGQMIEDVTAYDAKYGKTPIGDLANAKGKVEELQNEGFFDAYAELKRSGDIRKAGEKFNEVGKKKVDVDSLFSEEAKHPVFGVPYKVIRGKYQDGTDFRYDPIEAAAVAGTSKAYLERFDKDGKEKIAFDKEARSSRQKDRELSLKEKELDEVKSIRAAAYAKSKEGVKPFEFRPADQARVATQVAHRMQVVDPVSNKEVDHEATADAIALAGDIVRKSKGEIGLDEAVGLVAKPSLWLTDKEAEAQARKDAGKMKGAGLMTSDLQTGDGKRITKEEYVKQRKQELIDENRQKIRERVQKYVGTGSGLAMPPAARGLPSGGAREVGGAIRTGLSPAAKSVLDDALK